MSLRHLKSQFLQELLIPGPVLSHLDPELEQHLLIQQFFNILAGSRANVLQLQAALAENTRLNNQLTELQSSRAAYEDSLENLYESSSWRLTAPLRALRRLLRG